MSSSLPTDKRIVPPGREQDAPATAHIREQDAPATLDSTDSKVGGACSSPTREQDTPAALWEYFNSRTEIDIRTGGHLPHWEQGTVWYFITFRLADALPRAVIEDLVRERERWIATHTPHPLTRDQLAEYHRLFAARYEDLLHAGSGSCVLRDPLLAGIVRDALGFFAGQRYLLDEHVIMPNHVHALVKPLPGHGLVAILHSWKSFTANRINRHLGRTGQLWQHESYDHIVRSEAAMGAIRRYIRANPTK